MVKSVLQSASLGDYKTELAGNANLLENGSVPSSTENSQRDPGFTGSPKAEELEWKTSRVRQLTTGISGLSAKRCLREGSEVTPGDLGDNDRVQTGIKPIWSLRWQIVMKSSSEKNSLAQGAEFLIS